MKRNRATPEAPKSLAQSQQDFLQSWREGIEARIISARSQLADAEVELGEIEKALKELV